MGTDESRHRRRRFASLLAALSMLIIAVSCGGSKGKGQGAANSSFSYAENIGWVHGACLAIANANLTRGTGVSLVITGEPQKVQQARIQEKTASPEACPALMEGRAKMNSKPGIFFYSLEAGSASPTDMGFGIVAPPTTPAVVNGLAQADLDRDGHSEVFSSCATSEGIKFAVWTDKPYQGEPRWSAYYRLDYDMTPNCP